VSKKKNKFDLTHLVHGGQLKEGQILFFVSDPNKKCQISKQPSGEFKVIADKETMTIHAFAQKCLGQEPPIHASKWLRTDKGVTLYDLWHPASEEAEAA
jgi:hypothetical protein